MNSFQFNNCNVCTNPEVIFHYKPLKSLAWDYLELRVCQDPISNNWDFGYNSSGGCGPCSSSCAKYKSKEEAIEAGYKFLYEQLSNMGSSELSRHINDYINKLKDRIVYNAVQSPSTHSFSQIFAGTQLSMF